MTSHITLKDLEALVLRINKAAGTPLEFHSQGSDGKLRANIGHYYISQAYGGVCPHQILSEGGAIHAPLSGGHITKRELYNELQAFLSGPPKPLKCPDCGNIQEGNHRGCIIGSGQKDAQ